MDLHLETGDLELRALTLDDLNALVGRRRPTHSTSRATRGMAVRTGERVALSKATLMTIIPPTQTIAPKT